MDPLTLSVTTARTLTVLLPLPRLLRETAVPLMFGALAALGSTGGYMWQLADKDLGGYFSSAAQVGVGVLVSLIIEGAVWKGDDDPLIRSLRAGTLAQTAAGTAASLVGLLVSGAVVVGLMFALTWGGLAAGVIGLLVFAGDPTTARRVPPQAPRRTRQSQAPQRAQNNTSTPRATAEQRRHDRNTWLDVNRRWGPLLQRPGMRRLSRTGLLGARPGAAGSDAR